MLMNSQHYCPTKFVAFIALAITLIAPPSLDAGILATWNERLTGGAGTGGSQPTQWRYFLVGPDGTRLFGDVVMNDSASGQTFTTMEGDVGFDAFVDGITDGNNETIDSRRGPFTTNYPYNLFDGIYGAIYKASDYGRDVSEQTLIGSAFAPDLAGATIDSIVMHIDNLDLNNVGSGSSTASYLTGDLVFTINGTAAPIPEPSAALLLLTVVLASALLVPTRLVRI